MRTVLALALVACERLPPETEVPYRTDGSTADTRATSDTHDTGTPVGPTVRLVTWNVEGLGAGDELQATLDVLSRLDGDVVGLQEVDEKELATLTTLAAELGYPHVQLGGETPFGSLRNAVLSRLPGTLATWSATALSGDPAAEDVTRQPVTATVDGPWGSALTVAVQHCKAGFDDIDEFRRTVDALRTAQARSGATVVMGDLNADPRDDPEIPASFTGVPGGAPSAYRLGSDVSLDPGLVNDPFEILLDAGFTHAAAAQGDGRVETRDSGRWIDHVLADGAVRVVATEIYDSRDDGPGGLPKAGSALPRPTVRTASDHLPVLADVTAR